MLARALILEDDTASRKALVWLLEREGFACQSFSDPTEALKTLSPAAPPKLAMIDLNLPRLDGEQFLEQARAAKLLGDAAVVAMTAGERRAPPGVDAFLMKPFSEAQLRETLHKHLRVAARLGFTLFDYQVDASHAVEQFIAGWSLAEVAVLEAEVRSYLARILPGLPALAALTVFGTLPPVRAEFSFDHAAQRVSLVTLVKLR